MLLLLQVVILVVVQALLVLFHKMKCPFVVFFAPLVLDQASNIIVFVACSTQSNASILPLSG